MNRPRLFKAFVFILFFTWIQTAAQVLPSYTAVARPGHPEGFYFLSVAHPPAKVQWESPPVWNMIFNGKGELIYYRKFVNEQKVTNLQLLPNNLISYFNNNRFYFMDSTFAITDSVFCQNGYQTDHHEILVKENGNRVLLGTETFTTDLRSYKVFNHMQSAGSPTAQIIAGIIQELDSGMNVIFEWRAREHFQFSEVDTFYLSDPTKVDWTHFNSLDLSENGDLLLSIRHFNELCIISPETGRIVARINSKNNQFRFINDPAGFLGQHDGRLHLNTLSLFDNGRPGTSLHPLAIKEYKMDKKRRTLTLMYQYKPGISHSVKGLGNFLRIKNGLLINYGNNSVIPDLFSVIDKKGSKLFNLRFADTLRSYRVYYYPRLPFKLHRPVITQKKDNNKRYLQAEPGHATYMWNTGETGRRIEVTRPGKYHVWVQAKTGFISSETIIIK